MISCTVSQGTLDVPHLARIATVSPPPWKASPAISIMITVLTTLTSPTDQSNRFQTDFNFETMLTAFQRHIRASLGHNGHSHLGPWAPCIRVFEITGTQPWRNLIQSGTSNITLSISATISNHIKYSDTIWNWSAVYITVTISNHIQLTVLPDRGTHGLAA